LIGNETKGFLERKKGKKGKKSIKVTPGTKSPSFLPSLRLTYSILPMERKKNFAG
jgi:hypothetical protein